MRGSIEEGGIVAKHHGKKHEKKHHGKHHAGKKEHHKKGGLEHMGYGPKMSGSK